MSIVRFNRKFTQTQLTAAEGTSSINGTAVVDGSWYIAKTGAIALYVGSVEESGASAILKKVADIAGGSIEELDAIVSKSASGATDSATARTSSVQVVTGLTIEEVNGKLVPGSSSVTSAKVDMAGAADKAYEDAVSSSNAYTDTTVSSSIAALDATVSKSASGATDSASTRTDSVQVISGFELVEVDGKLVPNSSSVTSKKADMAGAADKAYVDAKNYADGLISGLGSIMTFKGTKATEAAIKAITSAKAGDVWVCSADGSEWVCTKDITAADPTAWEKFGTTDVSGALYKGDNVFVSGSVLIADGTTGKVKAVTGDDLHDYGIRTYSQAGAIQEMGAGQHATQIEQDQNGDINVNVDYIGVSGSVGTTSSASDAWKTVVHDVNIKNDESTDGITISGNTKSIPAATTGSDGYMTSTQATKLDGIEAGAEVNQNAFSSVVVGSTTSSASSKTASFTVAGSTNVTASLSGTTLTLSSPNVTGSVGYISGAPADYWKNPVVYVFGNNHGITGSTQSVPAATTASDGYMPSSSVINLNTAITALTWEE